MSTPAPAEPPPVLRAEGIHKSFPSGPDTIEVLRGVDCVLLPGTSLSVRGPSGGGKTTLLNILAGLETPTAGTAYWGEDPLPVRGLSSLARRRARYIGMVFQAYYLVPELNALENTLLAARIAGGSVRDATARAKELLDLVGMGERLRSHPAQLSGGERQRVAVARALMNRPAAILADEPTGNLDERTGESIMEVLLNATREAGASLLLVTHNRGFAAMTDKAFRLEDGHLRPL
ncbi:MAG: ABC transporter ATP-binding protein [Opitutales bacterium]|nr:ABC transporter ATP-binding protein [Opitutales bacterium]